MWDWEDDRTYRLSLFLLIESDGRWESSVFETKYRAILRAELGQILEESEFEEVEWRMPEETGYFQPVVTGIVR